MWWKDRQNGNQDARIPDELKGKSPEELIKIIQDGQKLADDLKAAQTKNTELETTLNTQKTEFETLKAKVTELEANRGGGDPNAGGGDPNAGGGNQDDPPSPWTDPEGFVRDQTKNLTNVALASGILSARMYFEQNLSDRDRRIYKKFAGDVEKTVGQFAPEARIMPQSWQNAFLYVKGLNESAIRKAESEKTDFFAEEPSRGGPDPGADDGEVKLTAAEEEACRKFHWDPKGYLERKKTAVKMESDRGAYAHYPVPTR